MAGSLVRKSAEKVVSADGEVLDYEPAEAVEGEERDVSVSSLGEFSLEQFISPSGDSLLDDDSKERRAAELLAEVEELFEKKNLDEQDEPKIKVIKDLVNNELIPDLKKEKEKAQEQVNKNIDRITKCNSDTDKDQKNIKSTTEATVGSSRTTHATCRAEEKKKETSKNGRCGELDTFLNAVNVPAQVPSGKPRDEMVKYVESMSEYFCPKGPEAEKLDEACKQAEKEHAEHQSGCNRKQASFELAFCTWRTQLTDECNEHDGCYSDALKTYKQHLEATWELIKKWKVEYKSLKKIVCYTDVWMNNNDAKSVDSKQYDTCKTTEADGKDMEINNGTVPAKNACDLSPTATHPGTSNFAKVEYNAFATYASSPIPCVGSNPVPETKPVETNSVTPTAAPIPVPEEVGTWVKAHDCTHCGNRGSDWKRNTKSVEDCGKHCEGSDKVMLIYNHVYDNCRCYSQGHCEADNRVTASASKCTHAVYKHTR